MLFIVGSGMRRFLLFLWISSLFFGACFVSSSGVQGQSSDTPSLELQGFVWNHSSLNVLVVTADNESWWNPAYLNITLRAIGQWNEAIAVFASNNSDFSYLSSLRLESTVSSEELLGFDMYVNWTDSALSNTNDVAGLSQITPTFSGTIKNCTTTLSVRTNHGDPLKEVDMQNVALHELGHNLGLGHSNYTGDLMYSTYNLGSSGESVSTLDVYGVATVFAWEGLNATSFYPVSSWLNVSSVVLPADVSYQGLPVSQENASPQTVVNNSVVQFLVLMFEIIIHPEILAIVILFFVVLVVIALIPKRRKRGSAVKVDS
jgi:hypothetical protein